MPQFTVTAAPLGASRLDQRTTEVEADFAVVGAFASTREPGRYRVRAELRRCQPGTFGRPDTWESRGTAVDLDVDGLSTQEPRRYPGDRITCAPTDHPVWRCGKCQSTYNDLPAAARCAAACWDRLMAHCREGERRFWETNRDQWWAKPPAT